MEKEPTNTVLRGAPPGNLISGMKRRLSDSSSMFVEERYQETDSMSGLTENGRHLQGGQRRIWLGAFPLLGVELQEVGMSY